MSFNSPFLVDDPRRTTPPMSAPTSVEFDPATQASYMNDINFLMAYMEESFPYESGTLPKESTPIQPEAGPVSTFLDQ